MGKLVATSACVISATVVGAPSMPGFVPGSATVVTPPSTNVFADGSPVYSGPLTVTVPLVFAPPAFVPITPPGGIATCTITPTGTTLVNNKPVVLMGDMSVTVPWTGTAAATSSSPIPCAGTVMVTIQAPGSTTVNSG